MCGDAQLSCHSKCGFVGLCAGPITMVTIVTMVSMYGDYGNYDDNGDYVW